MSVPTEQKIVLPTVTVLSEALRQYYLIEGKSSRILAKEWGCSHATVARFLTGKEVAQAQFITILSQITKPIFEEKS